MPTRLAIGLMFSLLCLRLFGTGYDFSRCRSFLSQVGATGELQRRNVRLNLIEEDLDRLATKNLAAHKLLKQSDEAFNRFIDLLNGVAPKPEKAKAKQDPKPQLTEAQREQYQAAAEAAYQLYHGVSKRWRAAGGKNEMDFPLITLLADLSSRRKTLLKPMLPRVREKVEKELAEADRLLAKRLALGEQSETPEAKALDRAISRVLSRITSLDVRYNLENRRDRETDSEMAEMVAAEQLAKKHEAEDVLGSWSLLEWKADDARAAANVLINLNQLALRRQLVIHELAKAIPLNRKMSSFTREELNAALRVADSELSRLGEEVDWHDPLRTRSLSSGDNQLTQVQALERLEAFSEDSRVPPIIRDELRHNIRFIRDFNQTPSLRIARLISDLELMLRAQRR